MLRKRKFQQSEDQFAVYIFGGNMGQPRRINVVTKR
jgi:hypothetical protein